MIIKYFKNRIKATYLLLFKGQLTKFNLRAFMKFYWSNKDKKNILIQVKELIALALHWKVMPWQYLIFEMYLKECKMTIKEMKNYLPHQIWYKMREIDKPYWIVCGDKSLSSNLFYSYDIPQPGLICHYHEGVFYDKCNQLLSEEQTDKAILNSGYDYIFVKNSTGSYGHDVFSYKRSNDGYYNGNHKLSTRFIKENFPKMSLIIQEGIIQNKMLESFNPDSLNTVRILTKCDKGKASIIAALVKFGRKGSIIDSCHGGLIVNVDVETGELSEWGRVNFDSNKYFYHPDTKIQFSGKIIPEWEEMKRIVIRGAQAFHNLIFIGWDVAVTDNRVIVIEINSTPGIINNQKPNHGLADKILDKRLKA